MPGLQILNSSFRLLRQEPMMLHTPAAPLAGHAWATFSATRSSMNSKQAPGESHFSEASREWLAPIDCAGLALMTLVSMMRATPLPGGTLRVSTVPPPGNGISAPWSLQLFSSRRVARLRQLSAKLNRLWHHSRHLVAVVAPRFFCLLRAALVSLYLVAVDGVRFARQLFWFKAPSSKAS